MIYKIINVGAIGDNAPHPWSGAHGDFIDYKVKFADTPQVIKITRKPTSAAPQVGDEVEGTIDMSAKGGPKFKPEYNQNGAPGGSSGRSNGSGYEPRDNDRIVAQWAIGQAVTLHNHMQTGTNTELDTIEALATNLFTMVERVKATEITVPPDPVDDLGGENITLEDLDLPEGF